MDDLSARISSILNDPDSMAQIRSMAEGMLGGTEKQKNDAPDIDIGRLLPMIQKINSKKSDKRCELLMALRPHLSEERQQRVDRAVKILRVIDMLPLLQDSGIFEL